MVVLKILGWAVLIGSIIWTIVTIRRQQNAAVGRYIRVLERIPVGAGQTLLYLEVDEIGIVVGVTPHHFDALYITDYKLSEQDYTVNPQNKNLIHLRPMNIVNAVEKSESPDAKVRNRLWQLIERTASFLRNGGNKEQ